MRERVQECRDLYQKFMSESATLAVSAGAPVAKQSGAERKFSVAQQVNLAWETRERVAQLLEAIPDTTFNPSLVPMLT
jgi:hypothetical protein